LPDRSASRQPGVRSRLGRRAADRESSGRASQRVGTAGRSRGSGDRADRAGDPRCAAPAAPAGRRRGGRGRRSGVRGGRSARTRPRPRGAFADRELTYKYERRGTNLCHYIRVIFLYVPLILLAQLLFWAAAVAVLLVIPTYWFSFAGWAKFLGIVALIIALFFGFVFACMWLSDKVKEWRQEMKKAKIKKLYASCPQPQPDSPTVWQMIKEWVLAQKKKICPLIRWNYEEVQ